MNCAHPFLMECHVEGISMRQGEERAKSEPWSATVNTTFTRTNKKSSDIAGCVHVGNDDLDVKRSGSDPRVMR